MKTKYVEDERWVVVVVVVVIEVLLIDCIVDDAVSITLQTIVDQTKSASYLLYNCNDIQ